MSAECPILSRSLRKGGFDDVIPSGLRWTIIPPSVRNARNQPLAIGADKVEQVRPAMIHLAIHQELKRRPHHRKIVVDSHQRIMYALLDLRGARLGDPLSERFKGHLDRFAVAHQDHGSAW